MSLSVMATVYIFADRNRFNTAEALRDFVEPTYTDDGQRVDSRFMYEVGFTTYEPGCVETIFDEPQELDRLLQGASYSEQWLTQLDINLVADSAICVYKPNHLRNPKASSLKYIGAFSYEA